MILKQGSKGPLVVQWQQMLNQLITEFSTKVDGDFGPETAKHTRYFQELHNLQVDGEVGPQTLSAARNIINGTNNPILAPGSLPDAVTDLMNSPLIGAASNILHTIEPPIAKAAGAFPWKWVIGGGLAFLAYKKYRGEKVVIMGKRIV